MMDLHKSYQLTRFRLAVVIIIVAVLIGALLRFFETIQASIEQVSVNMNLISAQQLIRDQNLMTQNTDKTCSYLGHPDLFIFSGSNDTSKEEIPGSWSYDPKKHQLTYYVRSTAYFRSNIGQKIRLDLYCDKGVVLMKRSTYQWCNDKRIFGCGEW